VKPARAFAFYFCFHLFLFNAAFFFILVRVLAFFFICAAANAAECLSAICHPPRSPPTYLFRSALQQQDNEPFWLASWHKVELQL